ncbi:unnamed protein product [Effrenium voratum]|nr:unnamed protein product [Effrenium voratum]
MERWYIVAMTIFCVLTPVGVLVGAAVEGSLAGSVLLALSAGTFLYIGLVETLPGARRPWLPTALGRALQMMACLSGFGAMSVLALFA